MILRTAQERLDGFFVRNADTLKDAFRIIFGIMWAIDGSFKFLPGFLSSFPDLVSQAGQGQPQWLSGWFSFWTTQATANPALFVYSVGIVELVIAFSLIFGFMRKMLYGVGFLLSLMIWVVPEGFGGPYGAGSTDIGTGIIYAMVFVLLAILDATYGISKYTIDSMLERRISWWKRVSEVKGRK